LESFYCDKKWGLRSLKAFEFKKWGVVEPSSLIEVYAYDWNSISNAHDEVWRPLMEFIHPNIA